MRRTRLVLHLLDAAVAPAELSFDRVLACEEAESSPVEPVRLKLEDGGLERLRRCNTAPFPRSLPLIGRSSRCGGSVEAIRRAGHHHLPSPPVAQQARVDDMLCCHSAHAATVLYRFQSQSIDFAPGSSDAAAPSPAEPQPGADRRMPASGQGWVLHTRSGTSCRDLYRRHAPHFGTSLCCAVFDALSADGRKISFMQLWRERRWRVLLVVTRCWD